MLWWAGAGRGAEINTKFAYIPRPMPRGLGTLVIWRLNDFLGKITKCYCAENAEQRQNSRSAHPKRIRVNRAPIRYDMKTVWCKQGEIAYRIGKPNPISNENGIV